MTRSQLRALGITLFPMLLAVGIPTIPVVSDYSDHALAAQAARNTVRWFWGHGISAVAFGFATVASCLIADHLYHKGEGVDIVGPAFVAMGAALYAAGLGADGIGPVSILAAGGFLRWQRTVGWRNFRRGRGCVRHRADQPGCWTSPSEGTGRCCPRPCARGRDRVRSRRSHTFRLGPVCCERCGIRCLRSNQCRSLASNSSPRTSTC